MISKQHFINKIRDLGYTFKRQADRVDLWRKKGGTHYIAVPRSDYLEEDFVSSSLRQAGREREEILSFIAAAKS